MTWIVIAMDPNDDSQRQFNGDARYVEHHLRTLFSPASARDRPSTVDGFVTGESPHPPPPSRGAPPERSPGGGLKRISGKFAQRFSAAISDKPDASAAGSTILTP